MRESGVDSTRKSYSIAAIRESTRQQERRGRVTYVRVRRIRCARPLNACAPRQAHSNIGWDVVLDTSSFSISCATFPTFRGRRVKTVGKSGDNRENCLLTRYEKQGCYLLPVTQLKEWLQNTILFENRFLTINWGRQ
ncbi:hypothetical protein Tcan_06243 [Toxocara canis]|uniref:Uncharacterized protein n=1 Tax=Toxocara canis TaxID=6265 RepID=A0A0B2VUJ9_TOXCA|nr:hypothetical protein Tcan_06243 [Toxocara canis]